MQSIRFVGEIGLVSVRVGFPHAYMVGTVTQRTLQSRLISDRSSDPIGSDNYQSLANFGEWTSAT